MNGLTERREDSVKNAGFIFVTFHFAVQAFCAEGKELLQVMEDAVVTEYLTVQTVFLFFNLILPVSLKAALFVALDFVCGRTGDSGRFRLLLLRLGSVSYQRKDKECQKYGKQYNQKDYHVMSPSNL